MPGRSSKKSIVLPKPVAADDGALQRWLARAFDAGGALPPKAAKAGKPRAKKRPKRA